MGICYQHYDVFHATWLVFTCLQAKPPGQVGLLFISLYCKTIKIDHHGLHLSSLAFAAFLSSHFMCAKTCMLLFNDGNVGRELNDLTKSSIGICSLQYSHYVAVVACCCPILGKPAFPKSANSWPFLRTWTTM